MVLGGTVTSPDKASVYMKFRRFDWEERRAFVEAWVLLLLAAPAVRMLPLSWIGRVATLGPYCKTPLSADRLEVLTWIVHWAVSRAAKRSPLRAKCFEQGLAAQIMLRRRGIDSTMLYGVGTRASTSIPGPINAHVWIETEQFPVIGDPEPGNFALMATWPQGRQAIWAVCLS